MKKNKQIDNKPVKKRKGWFKLLKQIMRIRYKRPVYVYLGKEFDYGTLILSNHEGTDAPMALEIYSRKPIRWWGAAEMNSGLVSMYKYQSRVYFHEKKHWSLFGARAFCLIASPLTNMFYSGFDLISTYRDARLIGTIRESVDAIKQGYNIVIYPEDSTKGYLEEMEGFHGGFVILAETLLKKGIDVPICASYYRKKDRAYIFDEPIPFSVISKECNGDRIKIADKLRLRCNELGKMEFDEKYLNDLRQEQKIKSKQKDKSNKKL